MRPHEILWKEICRQYAGEIIPKELADAKREMDGLEEQLEACQEALRQIKRKSTGVATARVIASSSPATNPHFSQGSAHDGGLMTALDSNQESKP